MCVSLGKNESLFTGLGQFGLGISVCFWIGEAVIRLVSLCGMSPLSLYLCLIFWVGLIRVGLAWLV